MTDLIIIKSDNELAKDFMLDVSRVKTVDPHIFNSQTCKEKIEQIACLGDTGIKIKHADGTITYHANFAVNDVANSIIINQAMQKAVNGSKTEELLANILTALTGKNEIAPESLPTSKTGEWRFASTRHGVPNPLKFKDVDSMCKGGVHDGEMRVICLTLKGGKPIKMQGFTELEAMRLLQAYKIWFDAQPCNQPKDQKANQTIREIADRHLEIIDNKKNPTRHIELSYGKIDTYRKVFDIIRKEGKPDRIHTEINNTEKDRVMAHIYYSWKGEE